MNNNDIDDRYQCQPSTVALAGRRRVDLSVTPRSWRQASETSPFSKPAIARNVKSMWQMANGFQFVDVGVILLDTWESLEDSPDTPTFLH